MKILIVGLGSIARKHIAAIREVAPEAEIYALRSSSGASSCEGVRNLYELKDSGLKFDFAIISNPTSLHAATIEQLSEFHIPLFIEKPLFADLGHEEQVKEIVNSGVITYVACNLRFLDSLRFLHDYIASHPERRINEVNVYCGSYLPEWRPGTDFRKCYSAIAELGGGAHLDLIHDIDYVCWIFGMPVESFGICRNVSSLHIDAIDYASYLLIYPEFTASVTLNYYRRDYRRTIEIVFEDATWTADLKQNEIRDADGNTVYKGSNSPATTYADQMDYFIRLIRSGERAENDIASAYDVLKICMKYERP